MPEVTQTVQVNLQGAGNLPKELKAARDAAREASRPLDDIRKSIQQLNARRLAIATPEGTRMLREQAAAQKALSEATRSAIDPAWKAKEAFANLTRVSAVAFGTGAGMIRGLGGLFNPYAAERFSWALKDAGAAVGRDLVPHLETGTRLVRQLGDAYLSLDPSIRKAASGLLFYGTAAAGAVLAMRGLIGLKAAAGTVLASVGALGASGGAGAGGAGAAAGGLLARGGLLKMGLVGAGLAGVDALTDNGKGYGGTLQKAAGSLLRGGEWLVRGAGRLVGLESGASFNRWREHAGLIEREKWRGEKGMTPEDRARLKEIRAAEAGGGAYGMAARPPGLMGPEAYLKALALDAMHAGGKPEERTAAATEEMRDLMRDMVAGGLAGVAGSPNAQMALDWLMGGLAGRGTAGGERG